jgi:AcrR family transcriptional regulator
MEATKPDQRREAGLRTRGRLIDAALDLLSQRGEDGVTLRAVTDVAGANVAAVSYHFGSLQALCDAAIEQALEQYLDAQQAAVQDVPADATVEELASAFARPMIRSLVAGGRELAAMRIVARAGLDPPPGWDRLSARFEEIRARVVDVLKGRLAGTVRPELIFRTRCAAGMLNWLVLAPIGSELAQRSERQIERLLVPIVAGALRGDSSERGA